MDRRWTRAALAGLLAVPLIMGCAGEYAMEEVGTGGTIAVSAAPPPPRYEVPLACGYDSVYVPGEWDWDGYSWYWRSGSCAGARPGYVYMQPYFYGGVYHRGYLAPGHYRGTYYGSRYVPPPAPARSAIVPAPAPAYRGSVPPPAPAYRGPAPAPPPGYRGGPPARGYRNTVPPPAPTR